jgi:PPOX class probable F420-dependent enzyme
MTATWQRAGHSTGVHADLDLVRSIAAAEHGLAVVATLRGDGTVAASVVNAAVTAHPLTGEPVLAFVARGGTRKLDNLRRSPTATLVLRHGWEWVAVEGPVELAGPDDPELGLSAEQLRRLLRQIFRDAGGTHDDLSEYDRVMAAEGRTAVLVRPLHIYTNPQHARHIEQ